MDFLHYELVKQQALSACVQDGLPYPDVKELSPILLALIGDGIFSLYVRLRLLPASTKVRIVHTLAAKIVSAKMQAKAMQTLAGSFTVAEEAVIRRGRNAHSLTPKSASVAEYHLATAMEALFGWLLLTDQFTRLDELLEKVYKISALEISAGKNHN